MKLTPNTFSNEQHILELELLQPSIDYPGAYFGISSRLESAVFSFILLVAALLVAAMSHRATHVSRG